MVYTAGAEEAGTEANVSMLLQGNRGDTGWRPLQESRVHDVKWQSGQMDVFCVEAVDLGPLTSVELRHDGQDKGHSCGQRLLLI